RGKKFGEKIESLAKGMGEPDIMLMCLIFILAGAFAAVAKASTAVDSASSLSDKKYQNQIEKERPSGRSFFIFPFQTLFCPKLAQLRYFCRTSVY
ncbi:hypothetical protein J6U78_03300, partial [bacterium]|nr:hypothetical protein [bacterium]